MTKRTSELGDGWSLEEILSPDGSKRHTRYFYKNRQAPRIVIKTKLAKQLAGYCLIEKDLRNVLVWLDEIEKIYPLNERPKSSTFSPDRKRFNVIKGLFIASLTFYGKCFTSCEGRRVKLEQTLLDKIYHDSHNQIMHLRHNLAAHSGIDSNEEVNVVLVLPPKKNSGEPPTLFKELMQPDMLHGEDAEIDIKNLVTHVRDIVVKKIDQLNEKIMDEEILPKGEAHWYKKAKLKI